MKAYYIPKAGPVRRAVNTIWVIISLAAAALLGLTWWSFGAASVQMAGLAGAAALLLAWFFFRSR